MGRIFEKRKERMFARWAKNARAFTKMGKEVAIAVKLGGPDPAANPRLRMAIQTARSLNMPKDRIEAAIHRASAKDAAELQEIAYEAFGPHGVAIFVDTATDNPTRTVANVRSILNRWGGNLANTGALSFIFERKGFFKIEPPKSDIEEFELTLIDHGLEDIFEAEDGMLVMTSFTEFGNLQRALEDLGITVNAAGIQRTPLSFVEVTDEQESDLEKLLSALEEDDDVQHVSHNMRPLSE